MDFGTEIDGTEDFFQMFWPIIVSHKIDEDSPLWEISARDLTSKMQFEIVLTMEGITPETGNTIQVRELRTSGYFCNAEGVEKIEKIVLILKSGTLTSDLTTRSLGACM